MPRHLAKGYHTSITSVDDDLFTEMNPDDISHER